MISKPMFRANHAYVESVRLLIELHLLMKRGMGDEPPADQLREQMDQFWASLELAERDRLAGLSADLYFLEPSATNRHPDNPVHDEAFWSNLSALKSSGEYDLVLRLLRDRPENVGTAQASFLRGRAYEELNEPQAAVLFLAWSAELEPRNDHYQSHLFIKLKKFGQEEAAGRWARRVAVNSAHSSPPLLVLAAGQFRDESLVADEPHRSDLLSKSNQLLDIAISKVDDTTLDGPTRKLLATALLQRAVGADLMKDTADAIRSADRAIRLTDSSDDIALIVRGLLRFKTNRTQAISDLQKAVSLGTKIVWPYYALAHSNITDGHFPKAKEYASTALDLTTDPDAIANLWEIWAIASAEMNGDSADIQNAFQRALSYSPESTRIRSNYQLFKRRSSLAVQVGETWQSNMDFPTNEIKKLQLRAAA